MKILMNFGDYTHTPERKKQNTYGGVGYYRIIKPSQLIKGHEVKVIGKEILHFGNSLEEQWDNVFKEYDVYWTSYFCDGFSAAAVFYHAQKHGKKVVIDIDDNYFDVPESNLLYERFKPGKTDRAFLSTSLSFADALTVSTEPLKERIYEHIKTVHGIEKPIFVIPNANDINDWPVTPCEKHKDRVVIGYAGSNSHLDDLKMVLPAIKTIMERHPHVWFEMIGVLSKDDAAKLFKGFSDDVVNRIALVGATPTFKEYPEWLASQKWDIGIAPLVDTAFTRSKSHIKWLEYSMVKIPVIASRVYPYFMELCGEETIKDGETGLLVKPHEWEAALEKLITNPTLRTQLAENAYEDVKTRWQYSNPKLKVGVLQILENLSR